MVLHDVIADDTVSKSTKYFHEYIFLCHDRLGQSCTKYFCSFRMTSGATTTMKNYFLFSRKIHPRTIVIVRHNFNFTASNKHQQRCCLPIHRICFTILLATLFPLLRVQTHLSLLLNTATKIQIYLSFSSGRLIL
jgi:hypothetical protein